MQASERTVEAITAEIARIDQLLADPQIYVRGAARAQSVGIERGQLVKRLTQAEEAWLEASEAYERASESDVDSTPI
jgi:ATP-binding cassette subfamily F protein 3